MSSREVPAMANTTHRPSLCWLCYWGTAHRRWCHSQIFFFFFNDTATTEIYTGWYLFPYTTLFRSLVGEKGVAGLGHVRPGGAGRRGGRQRQSDRKSTRLNSSHTIQSRMPSSA